MEGIWKTEVSSASEDSRNGQKTNDFFDNITPFLVGSEKA